MNQTQPTSHLNDMLIMLLLPAPFVGILLIIGSVLLIANPDVFGGDDDPVEIAAAPTSTISAQALALATVNAAPPIVYTPPDVTSGGAVEVAAAMGYTPELIEAGQRNFLAVCTACHGTDARGIAGLGKTLINSEFVHSMDDQQLLEFVTTGRAIWDPLNTTGVEMPARGGNPGLTDADILSIIAYVRVLDGEPGVPSTTTAAAPETAISTEPVNTEPVVFVPLDVAGLLNSLGVVLPDPVPQPERDGQQLYEQACSSCHGLDGQGVENFGGNLLTSDLLTEQNSTTLFNMIHYGSPVWSENNESGRHMPATGGYPILSNEEIDRLIAYLYSLVEVQ